MNNKQLEEMEIWDKNAMKNIIYKVTNVINGKVYIGETVNFRKRKNEHKYQALKLKSSYYFHRALRKYGFENFKWKMIDYALSKEILSEMEKYYIKKLKTKVPNGYNLTDGGGGMSGFKFTEECRKKKRTGRYIKCLVCKKSFWAMPSQEKLGKKYCSIKCANIAKIGKSLEKSKKGKYKKCLNCGKKFYVCPSILKLNKGKYCSRKCVDLAKKKKGKYVNCLVCKKEFRITSSHIKFNRGKYCSRKCYYTVVGRRF